MFDHTLDVIKGPSLMHRLDFVAAPLAGQVIRAGGVCSVNASGQLITGCPGGAVMNRPMPMFAIQNYNDFDVNSDMGNITGSTMSTVVATGGFEIETTEHKSETYSPNDLLTAASTGIVQRMGENPYGGQVAVGCMSEGTSTNADGKAVLRFWTLFLPAGATNNNSSSSSSSQSSSSSSST